MKPIQFSCQIEDVRALKDRTLLIKLETQELPSDETARIFDLMQTQLWVALAEVELKESDLEIPEGAVEFKGDKTPSQRLRSRLYVYYKHTHGNDVGFMSWYEKVLDEFGNKYLEKLT